MSELFEKGILILREGINSVRPSNLFQERISLDGRILKIDGISFDLEKYRNLWILGAGKVSIDMGEEILKILKERVSGGFICGKEERRIEKINTFSGSHPIPDERSYCASVKMEEFIKNNVGKDDLCLFLLSGGASALVCYPAFGLTIEEKSKIHRALLESGASIKEVNIVRKHLSKFKGGKLSKIIPCDVINIVLSDVPGDDLESIGSGPLSKDLSTWEDVKEIFEKYGLEGKVPAKILDLIELGIAGEIEETLKEEPKNVKSIIIGNNLYALKKAKDLASDLGFSTLILTSRDEGLASDLAKFYSRILMEIIGSGNPINRPCCILAGGEAQVKVRGRGKGGRNQEFMLNLLLEMGKTDHQFLAISVDSDGIDGITDVSGAWIDNETLPKAISIGLDAEEYLKENDSYNFFNSTGKLIKLGITQTNVSDIRIFIVP